MGGRVYHGRDVDQEAHNAGRYGAETDISH